MLKRFLMGEVEMSFKSVFRVIFILGFWISAAEARVENGVLLLVDQPEILKALEENGFSVSEMVEADSKKYPQNKLWSHRPGYRSIISPIVKSLDALAESDSHLSVTMSKSHRLFNQKWLSSEDARYELVGVVNRLDRQPFSIEKNICGEIRFIYRLAYRKKIKTQWIYSRLPMTMNVVYWAQEKDCAILAKLWMMTEEPKPISALILGPLQKKYFKAENLKSVEINLQSVRWPSTTRIDFGGYAEYIMRVFKRTKSGDSFELAFMENTPDIQKLKGDLSQKKKLLDLIKSPEFLKKLDLGVLQIPDEFTAKEIRSVAFHGQSRLANRPFDQIYKDVDFSNAKLTELELLKSVAGIQRRLNELSCVGCHQTRSVAGFHFVGIDSSETISENAIKVSSSAHFIRDLPRRAEFVKKMAKGEDSIQVLRPFVDRSNQNEGEYGDHCALTDDPTFKSWNCRSGLVCRNDHAPENKALLGVCMNKEVMSGDPCDVGVVTQNADPLKDKVIQRKALDCGAARFCLTAGEGFPDGLCFGDCDKRPGESCGMIAVGGFNACLGSNTLFTDCLKNNTSPISMRACDENSLCRDDFICAGGKDGKGSCIPPYFLFQLRLDGHPKP